MIVLMILLIYNGNKITKLLYPNMLEPMRVCHIFTRYFIVKCAPLP